MPQQVEADGMVPEGTACELVKRLFNWPKKRPIATENIKIVEYTIDFMPTLVYYRLMLV